jgi:hypothetical protein
MAQRMMTTRTRIKPACRKMVGQSLNQRLFGGFTAAQAIEINPMMDQINVIAQQTVRLEWWCADCVRLSPSKRR